ncbi:hypothetical protein U1Q18_017816 [Sarracenia purpurea var. burkii]
MTFISASDDTDDRLSNFTGNVEVHFASRKKVEIQAKARNLLPQSEFVLPQVSSLPWILYLFCYCDESLLSSKSFSRSIQDKLLNLEKLELLKDFPVMWLTCFF